MAEENKMKAQRYTGRFKTASPDRYLLLNIRTKILEDMGFRVMRFTNEAVLYDTENTIQEIENKLK